MPPRKRRAVPESEDESNEDSMPPSLPAPTRRRTREEPDSSEGSEYGDDDFSAPSSTDVMVKKLVRLALASEYSRQPIRRTDISTKVLGEQGSRQFKTVFDTAQKILKSRFGMQMTELPGKEKVTIHQRRAAQKVEKASTSNKSWILTSVLPSKYRAPEILTPPKAPLDSTYTGMYSFIISLILINGGTIPEQKLDRYLKRTNADTYTPIDRTDRFLQRLCKEGYLVRTREMDGGEEIIEYILGPRGKMEVGAEGVAGLVREVFGRTRTDDDDMTEMEREVNADFEMRLSRTLGIKAPEDTRRGQGRSEEDAGEEETQRRRTANRRDADSSEEGEEDEDEEEDSD